MKAISVKQPWASLIANGRKTVELRSWPITYRGPLVIVASVSAERDALARFDIDDLPRGATVAIVDVVDVRPAHASDEAAAMVTPERGEYAWCLANPRPLAPVRVRGRLGLYDVDDALVAFAGVA